MVGIGGDDQEIVGVDWAVGRREKNTVRAEARRGVGGLDSGPGMDYWSSGEGIGSGSLRS